MDCPIIQKLLDLEIPVQLDKQGYRIEGFYKHGSVLLKKPYAETGGALYLVEGRYGDLEEIFSWEDLVRLNFAEWQKFYDRFDGWSDPDPRWLPELLRIGLIKARQVTVYEAA